MLNNLSLPTLNEQQKNQFMIFAVLSVCMFFASAVFAASGSVGLDEGLSTLWDEIAAMATGNTGRILMMMSLLGVVIFAVVSPNLIGFAACGFSLLVLSNATDFIESTLTATYSLLPAIGM
ncbi:hypothetical protein EIJ81_00535 (plasmid) [Aliivibrio salmonicida]|uniref:hypothetical protein n=1 Tax=Aliivibrio salmonicida TaxID=40269 RepID=UPI000F6D6600|nr:hypothetical protein [Aliivibrio salmonicida]AZL83386.1 hypothetical protein EIJ81_00535 [Aliivibrio salmonicida]